MLIDEGRLEDLKNRAQRVLDSRSEDRPLFVEFAGTPKSGKSTCIDTINHFFRRSGFKVLAPTEGASKRTPYFLKDNLVAYNVWSASYALTHILEGRYGSDEYQLVILDRGLFDALAWFELLQGRQDVTDEECSIIQNFLLVKHWREFVDTVFLFETDPGTSLERENRDKLIKEPGQAMNSDFLTTLNTAYQTVRQKYSDQFGQLHVVNTGQSENTTPQQTAYAVAGKIIDLLEQRAG